MASSNLPITAAQLAGNFCETLLYGMYLVTCTFCARTLLLIGRGREERWRRPSEIRWLMLTIAALLFFFMTFDVAIDLVQKFQAFVDSNDAEKSLLDVGGWLSIAGTVNQFTVMVLGDFVLIYRCWIVYGRRWLVIVPSIVLYLGALAVGGRFIALEAMATSPQSLASDTFRATFLAFFAITGSQNILTTSILIWRIWRVDKESERLYDASCSTGHRPRYLRRVMRLIAESGAAYTTMVFITFVVSATGSNALYLTSDMAFQMTGIAFNLIIYRSSPSRDQQFTDFSHSQRTMTAIAFAHSADAFTTFRSIHVPRRESKPQELKLTNGSNNNPSGETTVMESA